MLTINVFTDVPILWGFIFLGLGVGMSCAAPGGAIPWAKALISWVVFGVVGGAILLSTVTGH